MNDTQIDSYAIWNRQFVSPISRKLKSIADFYIHKVIIAYVIFMSSFFCEFAHIQIAMDVQYVPTPLNYNELDGLQACGIRARRSGIYIPDWLVYDFGKISWKLWSVCLI